MFKTRLISGIVLVLLALLTICTGGWVLFGTLLIVSMIGAFELYRAMHVHEDKFNSLEIISYAGIIIYYLSITMQESRYHSCAMIVALIMILFVYVFAYPKYHANQVMAAYFGVIYVAVMLSYIFQIRRLPDGQFMVWLVFICSWGCDTCAYCVGVLFGKHKMAPVLSPKKSIEGAVGGVVGAALLGFIFQWVTLGMSYEYAVICAIGGLISMVGDLAASAIKRNMEIKDYGKLIPGHGGILDRFDSVIITAPIIYYLSVFLF